MDNVTTVGIDLAKNVFSVHGVDASGAVRVRKTVSRGKLVELVAQLPPCLIGLEACSGAHEWARRFSVFGHTVKLMAPKFVIPYRRGGKNDGNDAEAICEAVARPNMRFVPVKDLNQQAVLTLHRVRQGFIEERTATINRVRGLLSEFGVVLPRAAVQVRRQAAAKLEMLPILAAGGLATVAVHATDLPDQTLVLHGPGTGRPALPCVVACRAHPVKPAHHSDRVRAFTTPEEGEDFALRAEVKAMAFLTGRAPSSGARAPS